jgi:hypothetical protein
MMLVYDLFEQKIDRNIKGVITIGEEREEEKLQELQEYVITNELDKHFHKFFEAFTRSLDEQTDAMGVWISGFFGSGKSHFLKMLGYLLANKPTKDKTPLEFFKPKVKDNLLFGDIARCVEKSNMDVIIFNIDSKAKSGSKSQKNSIIEVFNKVFNQHLGFCGEIAWLAEIEKILFQEGQYDEFKRNYEIITNKQWDKSRKNFYFDRDNIIKTLIQTKGMSEESAKILLEDGDNNFSLTIEGFSKQVKDYCDSKGKHHKVVFLIDEVGQYIGDNTHLMLNLQTVVEDLGKMLRGRAWVIVTSQEAIDSLTRSQIKGNDFSKIIGRFATKLSLSSANTDEVIKKRLLDKTKTARATLEAYYGEKGPILRNLVSFSSDTSEMKAHQNAEDFIDSYPFIPYQFNLMQKVFEQIRQMGATGKHLSEGERSMLSAFQEASIKIKDDKIGALVPLNYFYDSLETFLDSNIRRVFQQAESNSRLEKEKDIELLKILFMIRHVKEMPSNAENLTTLSIDSMDVDKIALKKQIHESLSRLQQQTLIQQNGDEYIFLTNEEQEVNREINHIEISESEVLNKMYDFMFEHIYPETKFKYDKYSNYNFNKKIDAIIRGQQQHDLTLWIQTAYSLDTAEHNQILIDPTMTHKDAVVVKLKEQSILDAVQHLLRTEKYLRQKTSKNIAETTRDILNRKQAETTSTKNRIIQQLEHHIQDADIYFGGQLLSIHESSAKATLDEAMRRAVENIYKYREYVEYSVNDVEDILRILHVNDIEEDTLFNMGKNKLALEAIEEYITRQHNRNIKITFKNVVNQFSGSPYGWKELDTAAMIARQLVKKLIVVKYKSNVIERHDRQLPNYLTKAREFENLTISLREKITVTLKDSAKKVLRDYFNQSAFADDEDELIEQIHKMLDAEINKLEKLEALYHAKSYPGKQVVKDALACIHQLHRISDSKELLEQIVEHNNDLQDAHEDLQPIEGFFSNQVKHFDDAAEQLEAFQRNQLHLSHEAQEKLKQIADILQSASPYGRIKELPALAQSVEDEYQQTLGKLKAEVKQELDAVIKEWQAVLNKENMDSSKQEEFLARFKMVDDQLVSSRDCNQVNSLKSHLQTIFDRVIDAIEQQKKKDGPATQKEECKVHTVHLNRLAGTATSIKTKEELDAWLLEIKKELEKYLDENTEIRLR